MLLDLNEMGTVESDLEEAGRTTAAESISDFYLLLRRMPLPATVNIEGWSVPTLRALLEVCKNSRHSIILTRASKTFEIVSFPTSAEMLDSLAAGILSDEI